MKSCDARARADAIRSNETTKHFIAGLSIAWLRRANYTENEALIMYTPCASTFVDTDETPHCLLPGFQRSTTAARVRGIDDQAVMRLGVKVRVNVAVHRERTV